MTPRSFRFQPLLDWAEQREERQVLVLAQTLHEEQAALVALDALSQQREDELVRLSASSRVDPEQRQIAEAYLQRLGAQIEAQRTVVEDVRGRVELARTALVELEQEKQSLDRLREQDEQRALAELDRREANVVDDLNMTRHARGLRRDRGVA